jgi:uncharacterized membrane protein required for colicin V production
VDLANLTQGNRVDLLIFLYFMGFFVLGYGQGTIRRLIGIASILFSFLFAANVATPLGDYLGANWVQFSKPYSTMLGFGTVFLASAIAFAIVAQSLYKNTPLFQKYRFVDELIGGLLGIVQAGLIFGAVLIILDSFFRIPGNTPDPNEIHFLRDFWDQLNISTAAQIFRETLIPGLFAITGLLIPDWIEALYKR